jgi:hypothetical protein
VTVPEGGKAIRCLAAACLLIPSVLAQTLAPRAYIITPLHSNAITMSYGYSTGGVQTDDAAPLTDVNASLSLPVISFYHSFGWMGRSANFTVLLPYAVGTYTGQVAERSGSIYRSGLLDSEYRFSINLYGGPAMDPAEFRDWRQGTLIGASIIVQAPTGQFDPHKLVNLGTGRWSFRPQLGLSRRVKRWLFDAYAGGSLYTTNRRYFPGSSRQAQHPIGALEWHVSYDVKPRLWFSADANYWYGGEIALNAADNPATVQRNSRVGFTASVPLSARNSLKFSYGLGALTRFGGDFQALTLSWQYAWIGRPN